MGAWRLRRRRLPRRLPTSRAGGGARLAGRRGPALRQQLVDRPQDGAFPPRRARVPGRPLGGQPTTLAGTPGLERPVLRPRLRARLPLRARARGVRSPVRRAPVRVCRPRGAPAGRAHRGGARVVRGRRLVRRHAAPRPGEDARPAHGVGPPRVRRGLGRRRRVAEAVCARRAGLRVEEDEGVLSQPRLDQRARAPHDRGRELPGVRGGGLRGHVVLHLQARPRPLLRARHRGGGVRRRRRPAREAAPLPVEPRRAGRDS